MRLIDADAIDVREVIIGASDFAKDVREAVQRMVDHHPTVEAAPVVHGEWLNFIGDYSTAECSECGECYEISPDDEPKAEFFELFKELYRFCPRCGARMDGKAV